MDIWRWFHDAQSELIEEGHGRLAELAERMSSLACDMQHEEMEAVYPEVLALARSAKKPWIEVFVRHWYLQSRVLVRRDARALPDAVSLLEFANRVETRDCPQSICAVQDLASAYEAADGPGYAAEREAVARECLQRIAPETQCYSCVGAELVSAIEDAGRREEALTELLNCRNALEGAGRSLKDGNDSEFYSGHASLLLRLGRPEEALELVEQVLPTNPQRSTRVSLELTRAQALTALGRHEESANAAPAWSAVVDAPSDYGDWCELQESLVEAKHRDNDWLLDVDMQGLQQRLVKHESPRSALEIALVRARLALGRDVPSTAARHVESARSLLPKLRAPLGAPEDIDRVATQVEEALSVRVAKPCPANPEGILEACGSNPETDLELIRVGLHRWPDDTSLRLREAQALLALRRTEECTQLLTESLERSPVADDRMLLLAEALLAQDKAGELRERAEALLESCERDGERATLHWVTARSFMSDEQPSAARPHLERVLELDPEAVNTRVMLAKVASLESNFEEAFTLLSRAVELLPERGNHHWELIVVSTILGRWDVVRDCAETLGMELEGDAGPVDERWETCEIRFETETGSADVWAGRTGPVTARILEMSPRVGHHGDLVVFYPAPLNEGPEEGDEDHRWVYPNAHVLESGGFVVVALEGLHPGEESMESLTERLGALDVRLRDLSSDDYIVESEDGRESLGLYAMLAIPEARTSLEETRARLEADVEKRGHRLFWPMLLARLDDEAGVEAQNREAKSLGLSLDA